MREKLIELLDDALHSANWVMGDYYPDTDEVADHLIANGVTIQKWIPVTERLPEHDLPKGSKVKQIKVLVAYKTNSRWVTRTQIRAKGYWYGEPDRWSWVKTSDPITHWMPLPEPPSGERRTNDSR